MSAGSQKQLEPSLYDDPRIDQVNTELHVIIAGLPRSGKSAALNSIFGLNLESKASAFPVTKAIDPTKITQCGITMIVTDTPGLKSAGVNNDIKVLEDIKKIGLSNKILLLLTLSINLSSSITIDYQNILQNLTAIFGAKVWNWSLILLTFSDTARQLEFNSDVDHQAYQDYVKDHCMRLQEILRKVGVNKEVKPFFEYTKTLFQIGSLNGIVAIPVGKTPEVSTEMLFPFQPWTHNFKWTDLTFKEIAKISRDIPDVAQEREKLILFRYGNFLRHLTTGQELAHKGSKVKFIADAVGTITRVQSGAARGRRTNPSGGSGVTHAFVGASIGAAAGGLAGAPFGILSALLGALAGLTAGYVGGKAVDMVTTPGTMDVIDIILELQRKYGAQ